MEIAGALDFCRKNQNAVVITTKANGGVQSSPVTISVDDDDRIEISSRETAYKVKNLRRDPRVWLCVLPDAFYGQWIQVEGEASIVSLPDAMDGLVAYYRRLSGEHPDWDDYRAAMERDQRLLIKVAPTKAGPTRSG